MRRARAGRAARARVGEFGSTRPLSRTRDYKHTRCVGSLSLDDQAESVSYATTCRLNRRNVTERYTARTDTWSDIIKDTVPFARSRSSPSIFASIFTNFAKSFSVRCVLESEKQYVVTKRSWLWVKFLDEDGARAVSGWVICWWLEVNIKPKKKNDDQRSNRRKFCELVTSRCHGSILDRWVNTIKYLILHNTSERVNYASVIKVRFVAFRAFNLIKYTTWTS